MKTFKKAIAILFALSVLLLDLIIFTNLNQIITLPLIYATQIEKAPVIINMGAGFTETGQPTPDAQERINKSVELFEQGYAPCIIMTGGIIKNDFNEAEVMKYYALKLGVPEEKIILEKQSDSTFTNALYTAKILRENGWEKPIVVTSPYHTRRTFLTFKKQGVDVYIQSPEDNWLYRNDPILRLKGFKQIMREYAATVYYKLKGRI